MTVKMVSAALTEESMFRTNDPNWFIYSLEFNIIIACAVSQMRTAEELRKREPAIALTMLFDRPAEKLIRL